MYSIFFLVANYYLLSSLKWNYSCNDFFIFAEKVNDESSKSFKLNRWTLGVTTAVAIAATIAAHVFGWGEFIQWQFWHIIKT